MSVTQCHLSICLPLTDLPDVAFTVTILRKETVTMYCDSQHLRDKLVAEFMECIDRAALCMSFLPHLLFFTFI